MSKTLDEIALGDHACVVMDSDEQHWEIAAGFVADGLRRAEKVLYYDGARSTEPLLRRLREDNIDVAQHLRSGQLAMFPPELTNQLWKLSLAEMATLVAQTIGHSLTEGYASVRVTDEPGGAAGPSSRWLCCFVTSQFAGTRSREHGHPSRQRPHRISTCAPVDATHRFGIGVVQRRKQSRQSYGFLPA